MESIYLFLTGPSRSRVVSIRNRPTSAPSASWIRKKRRGGGLDPKKKKKKKKKKKQYKNKNKRGAKDQLGS